MGLIVDICDIQALMAWVWLFIYWCTSTHDMGLIVYILMYKHSWHGFDCLYMWYTSTHGMGLIVYICDIQALIAWVWSFIYWCTNIYEFNCLYTYKL